MFSKHPRGRGLERRGVSGGNRKGKWGRMRIPALRAGRSNITLQMKKWRSREAEPAQSARGRGRRELVLSDPCPDSDIHFPDIVALSDC